EDISLFHKPEEIFSRPNSRKSSSDFKNLLAEELLDAKCPYCRNVFHSVDRVMFCDRCNALHHLDCWNTNSGCAIFGCEGKKAANIKKIATNKTVNFIISFCRPGLPLCRESLIVDVRDGFPGGIMKAIRLHKRGGPEQIVYENAPKPMIGHHDALVRVI